MIDSKKVVTIVLVIGIFFLCLPCFLQAQVVISDTAAIELRKQQEKPLEEKMPERFQPEITIEEPSRPIDQIPEDALQPLNISTVEIIGATVIGIDVFGQLFAQPQQKPQQSVPQKTVEQGRPVPGISGQSVFQSKPLFAKEIAQSPEGSFLLSFNREMAFADLNFIAQRVTQLYRLSGYVTSQAYVPPQTIEEGRAIVKIFEGKVNEVIIDGPKYAKKSVIEKEFAPLKEKVFYYNALLAALSVVNSNPDRRVRATLVASEKQGYSDIKVTIEERLPYHLKLESDNTGSQSNKYNKYYVSVIHNNVSGHDDIFSYKFNKSHDFNTDGHSISYSLPFNHRKTTFNLTGAYSTVRLSSGSLAGLEVSGSSYLISPSLSHELFSTPRFSLSGTVGFDVKKSVTNYLGSILYKDSLRIIKAGFTLSEFDLDGTTSFRCEASAGIPNFMGASPDNNPLSSRGNAGGKFYRFTGGLIRFHRLPWPSYSLLLSVDGQFTNHSLPSLEQFSLGGAYTVRGYPESDYSADRGGKISVELRMPFFVLPERFVPPSIKRDQAFTLVAFFDAGRGFIITPSSSDIKRKTLKGAGIGTRINLFDGRFSGRFDVGWPFGAKAGNGKNHRVHFSISQEF